MSNNETRLENCRISKTILMLFIVIYHCLRFWAGDWFTKDPYCISRGISIVCEWLNSFHVAAFTFVSFYYQKFELKKYQNTKSFIINKVRRLLIPYALISLLWAIPFGIHYYHLKATDIIHRFLLGIAPEQLWFLLMLFWVYFISFYLSSKWENSPIIGIAVILVLYITGVIGAAVIDNYFQVFTAFKYLVFFSLGFYSRKIGLDKDKRLFIILVPLYIVIFVLYLKCPVPNVLLKFVRIVTYTVCGCIGSILVFHISDFLTTKFRLDNNRFLLVLSSASMPIYLLHQQVIYITIDLFNGYISFVLNILISFVSAIAIPLIIYYILNKYKFGSYLFGSK